MFKIDSENYLQLETCLKEILNQIEELNEIQINNENFKYEIYFTCDLKCKAILCGINSANSDYPCIWCKAPVFNGTLKQNELKLYKDELKKDWSCVDKDRGARCHEESNKILKSQGRKTKDIVKGK